MSTLTTIQSTDLITNSRANLNDNFAALNADKLETSVLDSDTTLAANSDSKVPTQKAVKAYVDAGGQANASDTVKGIVEEATAAEVLAGTAVGETGARLYVNPSTLSGKAKVRAYKSGGNQQIDNSFEKVLFESESYDTGNDFASSTFTAPRNGYYLIQANGDGDANSSDTDRAVTMAIYKNGVIYSSSSTPKTGATGIASGASITDVLFLSATNTIEVYALCNASSVDFYSGERYTYVNIIEL